MSILKSFILPVIYITYIILGGIGFHFLEEDNEKTDTQKISEAQDDFLGKWNMFAFTGMSILSLMLDDCLDLIYKL